MTLRDWTLLYAGGSIATFIDHVGGELDAGRRDLGRVVLVAGVTALLWPWVFLWYALFRAHGPER